MVLTGFTLVAGIMMSELDAFKQLYASNSAFRERVETCYCDNGLVSADDIDKILPSITPESLKADREVRKYMKDCKDEESKTKQKRINIIDMIGDICTCDVCEYTLKIDDCECSIFHITHDVAEDTPFIVGIKLCDLTSRVLFDSCDQFSAHIQSMQNISEMFKASRILSNSKVYAVQDDCVCCK